MDQGYTTPQSQTKRLKCSRTYERGYAIDFNAYPNTCSFFDFFFFLVEKSRQAPIRSSRRSVCVKKGKMSQKQCQLGSESWSWDGGRASDSAGGPSHSGDLSSDGKNRSVSMYRTVLSREEDGPGFGARLTFPFRLILNLPLSGGDFSLLLGFLSAFIGIGKFRAPEGPDQPCRIKGTVDSPPLC